MDPALYDVVKAAYSEIPFYKRRGEVPASFGAVPLLTKNDLTTTLPKNWFPATLDAKAALSEGVVELVETAGTVGARARVLKARGEREAQEAAALALNPFVAAARRRSTYREAFLGTPRRGMGSCHAGDPPFEERLDGHVLHLNSRQDPTYWTDLVKTRMLDELARHETDVLLGDPAYLGELATFATRAGRTLHVRAAVGLGHSLAAPAHCHALSRAVSCPIFHFYPTTETGVLYIEDEPGRFHLADPALHVELVPVPFETPGAANVASVVVTTLGDPTRTVMPLLRYATMDLVSFDPVAHAVTAHEGRLDDVIVRPDGAWLTARAIAASFATLGEDAMVQATQRTPDSVELDVIGAPLAPAEDLARDVFRGLTVQARATQGLAGEASGRFRLSRRAFPLDATWLLKGALR